MNSFWNSYAATIKILKGIKRKQRKEKERSRANDENYKRANSFVHWMNKLISTQACITMKTCHIVLFPLKFEYFAHILWISWNRNGSCKLRLWEYVWHEICFLTISKWREKFFGYSFEWICNWTAYSLINEPALYTRAGNSK